MESGYALHGIKHRRGIVYQLQVIAVTGDDEGLISLRLGRQRGEDVVGLEVLAGEGGNPQHLEHLADDVNLALKFLRRGFTLRLVVREHFGAEGLSPYVECHRDGIGLLLRHDIGKHR